jgi:hypothetical protein
MFIYQAFEILQELIDECILDVAFEMHRQAKTDKLCTRTFQIQDSKYIVILSIFHSIFTFLSK